MKKLLLVLFVFISCNYGVAHHEANTDRDSWCKEEILKAQWLYSLRELSCEVTK